LSFRKPRTKPRSEDQGQVVGTFLPHDFVQQCSPQRNPKFPPNLLVGVLPAVQESFCARRTTALLWWTSAPTQEPDQEFRSACRRGFSSPKAFPQEDFVGW
jgi:hypothetical protein